MVEEQKEEEELNKEEAEQEEGEGGEKMLVDAGPHCWH